jgi:nicotinamide mononucleotide (NMN) deamidase PncC
LLGADISVATTGVGGPDAEEGQPAGTVFIAVGAQDRCGVKQYQFDGEPAQVVHLSTIQALRDLAAAVTAGVFSRTEHQAARAGKPVASVDGCH